MTVRRALSHRYDVVAVGQARLRVTNATNQTIRSYDISGAPIKTIKVDGPDKIYELSLRKGCYIVKVGNVVRKVSVS